MIATASNLERLATGSDDLDLILGGGFPVRSINLIAGEPGTGKTLLALQMIFHLARQGRKCMYLTTLSEPSLKLVRYMQQFSFFDESVVDRLHAVARHDWEHSHALDLSDEGLLADLEDRIEGSAQLLAIDDNDEYAGS